MSGKTSAADPAEYIKKPDDPKDDVNNRAATEEEPEAVRFSPEEEAVSASKYVTPSYRGGLYGSTDESIRTGASR